MVKVSNSHGHAATFGGLEQYQFPCFGSNLGSIIHPEEFSGSISNATAQLSAAI